MKKYIFFVILIIGFVVALYILIFPDYEKEKIHIIQNIRETTLHTKEEVKENIYTQETEEKNQTQHAENIKTLHTTNNQTYNNTTKSKNFSIGFVVKVHDGDTFRIEGLDKAIRILHIDTPEVPPTRDDYYGIEARDFLKSKILNKEVKLVCPKKDKYGRPLCEVYPLDADINDIRTSFNYLLIEEGFACPFMTKNEIIINASKETRNKKIGIFSENSTYVCREKF